MDQTELQGRIVRMVELEKLGGAQWAAEGEKIASGIIADVNTHNIAVAPELYKYLDDVDIRQKDAEYAKFQMAKVERVLNLGG